MKHVHKLHDIVTPLQTVKRISAVRCKVLNLNTARRILSKGCFMFSPNYVIIRLYRENVLSLGTIRVHTYYITHTYLW